MIDTAAVRIELDTREAEQDATRSGERAGRAFARAADRAAGTIDVDFDVHDQELRARLDAITRRLTIPVDVDVDDTAARAALNRLAAARVRVPAVVELDDAVVTARLARLSHDRVTIPAAVELDEASLARARATIEATRATVHVDEQAGPTRQVRADLSIDQNKIQDQLDRLPRLKINIDETRIAEQVAAGIKAGQVAAGQLNLGAANITGRVVIDRARLRASLRALGTTTIRARVIVDERTLTPTLRDIDLPVDVDTDRVTGALTALTARYRTNPVTIATRVDVDPSTVGNTLGGTRHLTVGVDVDEQTLQLLRTRVETLNPTLHATLDIDRDRLAGTLRQAFGPNGTLQEEIRTLKPTLQYEAAVDDTSFERVLAEAEAAAADRTVHIRFDVDDATLDRARHDYDRRFNAGEVEQSFDHLPDDLRRRLGDLSVQIRPNLDDIALRRVEDTVTTELGSRTVEISPTLDETAMTTVRRRLDDLGATVRVDLDETSLNTVRTRIEGSTATIRVRPDLDTAEFRTELAGLGTATIRVRPDLETAAFRTEVRALQDVDVTLRARVELDRAQIRAAIAALPVYVLRARLDLDTARARAELAALSRTTIRANVDVDSARITEQVRAAINRGIHLAGNVNVGASGGILGGLAGSLAGLFGSGGGGDGGTAGAGIAGFTSKIGGVVTAVAGAVLGLFKMSAAATAVAVAGAGIAAAYGAAATAVAVLPAVLALVAVPAATAALGIDGIQKAAKTLLPEFTRLKKSVSDTFETGFTRAFNVVRPLFDTVLGPGFNFVARSINGIVLSIAGMLKTADGATLLTNIFDGVGATINSIRPGVMDAADAILILLGRGTAFKAFTDTINAVGAAFRASLIDNINDGSLDKAFTGLGDLLTSLGVTLVDLVHNGIELFAGAAPGVTHVVDAISGFFNRFDYNRLGKAVSGVFDGLATAIDNVPDSTIDAITQAFEGLSKTFQDPAIQKAFTNIIDTIPTLIRVVDTGVNAFARIGSALAGFSDLAVGLATIIEGGVKALRGDFTGAQTDLLLGAAQIKVGMGKIGDAFADGGTQASLAAQGAAHAIAQGFTGNTGPTIDASLDMYRDGIGVALSRVTTTIQTGSAGAATAAQQGSASTGAALQPGDKDYSPAWSAATSGIPTAIGSNFTNAALQGKVGAQLTADATAPPTTPASPWSLFLDSITRAVTGGFGTATTSALQGAAGTASASAPPGDPSIGWTGAYLGVIHAVQTGGAGATMAAGIGATNTTTASNQGLAGLSPGATNAFAPLPGIARTGMAGVTGAVQGGVGDATRTAGTLVPGMRGAIPTGGLIGVGISLVEGLVAGIASRVGQAVITAVGLVGAIIAAARHTADSHSPSRVMMKLGQFMGEGLAIGLDKSSAGAVAAAADFTDSVIAEASRLTDAFSGTQGPLKLAGAPRAATTVRNTSTVISLTASDIGDIGAAVGGVLKDSGVGTGVHVEQTINNPVGEPTLVSTSRELRRVSELGVFRR